MLRFGAFLHFPSDGSLLIKSLTPEAAPGGGTAAFKRAWLGFLGYTLFVILFGALVRITGSGAGCGQHWPTCHGEIAHLPQTTETAIELTHRLTSGLCLVGVVALYIWARRLFPLGSRARGAAGLATLFMATEALVGAALVLLELVGTNDSSARAVVMGVHLVNTSLLTLAILGAVILRGSGALNLLSMKPLSLGAFLIVVVSAAGAVTALGDTLYPVLPGQGGLEVAALAPSEAGHFLERVRGVHPVLAVFTSVYLLWCASHLGQGLGRRALPLLILLQVGAGVVNIWLSAPAWLQILHLGLANLLWLAFCHGWLVALESQSFPPVPGTAS